MGIAGRAIKDEDRAIADLGALEGPIVVFGGAYSNAQATEALLRAARGKALVCTGDVIAYCAGGARTLALLRAAGAHVVAGNVERQLAAGALDCGCGFAPGTTCDRLSAGWFAHADAEIAPEARGWMAGLPDVALLRQAGRRFAVIHGGVTDIARFLWSTSPEAEFIEEIAALQRLVGPVDAVIAGHCGLAFSRRIDGVDWINTGVIGMPPNDGRRQTRYGLLRGGRLTLQRLDYDAAAAAEEMRRAGLTQGYDAALLSGFWPSEDILPPALRRRQSRAIG